jgi:hypothetical protein
MVCETDVWNGVHKVDVTPKRRTTTGTMVAFEIFVLHGKVHSRAKRLVYFGRRTYVKEYKGNANSQFITFDTGFKI